LQKKSQGGGILPENTDITVYEVSMRVYLLEDIPAEDEFAKIGAFIDSGMAREPKLLEFHQQNRYKNYCWNLLYPIERGGPYRKGELYSFQLRTVERELAQFFHERLPNHFSQEIKGLTAEIKLIPRRPIERIYSLTPLILKEAEIGYWKPHLPLSVFEKRLVENLLKKYRAFTGEALNEDFSFYTALTLLNEKPVPLKYKSVTLLGDKIELSIDYNETAQRLAYFCLGVGALELNARGAGFMSYRYASGRR
jgi:CRISPR-associated endoribonuclease Cas6